MTVMNATALNTAIRQAFAASLMEPLTARENEVLLMIGMGMTDRQIADVLHITPETAKTHARRVYSKLGIGHFNGNLRVLAAMYALRAGMVAAQGDATHTGGQA